MALSLVVLGGCGLGTSPSPEPTPGAAKTPQTKVIETKATVLQRAAPVDAISTYLNGFHLYGDNPSEQVEAHHYVTILNEDVMQAVIFDGDTKAAKLMGIEYIISARLFDALPPEEKQLWHSHAYEVKSGLLAAPGLPPHVEQPLMTKLALTYGKTWHTWHTDRGEALPLGLPSLMMAPLADGQIDAARITDRDRRLGVDTDKLRARRASIPTPEIDPFADPWAEGVLISLERVQFVPAPIKH